MPAPIGWEKRPENRGVKVENFKKCYVDHSIPTSMIAEEFGITQATVSQVARRLGLAARRERGPNRLPYVNVQTSLASIDAEEQELKRRLFELQQKRANLAVHVNKTVDGTFVIHGLTEDPFETTAAYIQNFLDGQGAGKLRDAVGRKS